MDTRQREPELLAERLLGALHAGPGLITRVGDRVRELGYEPGPTFPSGSILGRVDHRHYDDSASEERLFDLYLVLRRWLGLSYDRQTVAHYLARSRLTDVDALAKRGGVLTQVRQKVREYLRQPTDYTVGRCLEIDALLVDFLGSRCLHVLEPIPADGDITVLECPCGTRVHEDKRGNWLAV